MIYCYTRCKYFSQVKLSFNSLYINVLQNLLFCVLKAAVLHGKIISKYNLLKIKKLPCWLN